ncbi:MAG: hypothetical protein WC686_01850, partial [Candidatus Shapirobacteria bacterium]
MPKPKDLFTGSRFSQYAAFLKSSSKLSGDQINSKLQSLSSFQHFLSSSTPATTTSHQPVSSTTTLFNRYLIIAALSILTLGLGLNFYRQIIDYAKKNLAFTTAANPIRPTRFLSFQGRLTDNFGNPITSSVPATFKLYTAGAGGTELYTSGVGGTLFPDTNGIFSALIGKNIGESIPDTVFTENAEVWLDITINDENMNQRQQIATVPYAQNADSLQGLAPSAAGLKDTILVLDSSGNLNLGETSPSIISNSGTFTIQGQSLYLESVGGGNLFIGESGGIGIGNTNPLYLFHVGGEGVFEKLGVGNTSTFGLSIGSSGIGVTGSSIFTDAVTIGNTLFSTIAVKSPLFYGNDSSVTFGSPSYLTTITGSGVTLSSNVSIGSSLVSVGSNNIVSNLNADLLDGYHYNNLPYDNYQSWVANVGTSQANISSGTTLTFVSGTGISMSLIGNSLTVTNTGIGTTYTAGNGLTNNLNTFGL